MIKNKLYYKQLIIGDDLLKFNEYISHLFYVWSSSVFLFVVVLVPTYLVFILCNDFLKLELVYTTIIVILSALTSIWITITMMIALTPHDNSNPHQNLEKKE